MSSLSHHGIKGQRWGVRRYQNKDGTRTAVGKKQEKQKRLKKTSKDYASIKESLSDDDLRFLDYDDNDIKRARELGTLGHDLVDYGRVAHRVIQKDKNGTPVTYVDANWMLTTSLLTGKNATKLISIDLATRAGDEYRGKGYAVAAGKKMVKWFDTYGYKDYEYMEWGAKEKNIASQKTAEKLGFKKYEGATAPGWTIYTYEHKATHTSIGGTMYIEGNALILGDSSYLSHHGIKGQKWGVRRFQNKDGTLTSAGKKRYSVEAVDVNSSRKEIKKLVGDFSKKDKEFFFGEEDWYRDYDSNGDRVAKRFVIKEGKNIVAFIDAERGDHYYSNESLNIVVGTAQSARGKGYASILSKTMVDWYESEGYKDANMLEWNANKDNIGSRKAAEKAGFKEVLGDNDVGYRYSKNAKKELDELSKARMRVKATDKEVSDKINSDFKKTKLSKISPNTTITPYGEGETGWNSELGFYKSMIVDHYATKWAKKNHAEDIAKYTKATSDWNSAYSKFDKKRKAKHTSIGGTMYIEGNALILGDSSYLEHHGIRGQRWGVRRFQNRDGSLTNAGRKRLGYATKGVTQTVGKAFKAGVKAGGNAVKAVKAHHEKKEAEKLQKKKEKASKTRMGVNANKDLFTAKELKELNAKFEEQDKLTMARIKRGVEIAKAVGETAKSVGEVGKAYEALTGHKLVPDIMTLQNGGSIDFNDKGKDKDKSKDKDNSDNDEGKDKDDGSNPPDNNKSGDKPNWTNTPPNLPTPQSKPKGHGVRGSKWGVRKKDSDLQSQMEAAKKQASKAMKNAKLQEYIDAYNRDQNSEKNRALTARGQKAVEVLSKGGGFNFEAPSSSPAPTQKSTPSSNNLMAQIKAAQTKLEKPNKNETPAEHKEAQKKLNALEKAANEYKAAANKPGTDPAEVAEKLLKKNKDILDDLKHMDFSDTDYLEHYGVRGMKWGKHLMAGKGGGIYDGTALGAGGGGGPMTEEERKKAEALRKKKLEEAKKKAEEAAKEKEIEEKAKEIGISAKAYKRYSIDNNHLPGKHHYNKSQKLHSEASSSVAEAQASERQAHMNRAKAASLMRKVNSSHMFDADGYHISQQRGDDRKEAKRLEKEAKKLDKASKKALKKFYKKRYKADKERQKWQNSTSGKYHHMMRHYEIQNGVLFVDSSDGFEHHGVKGQRWGVRRFQNEDGSKKYERQANEYREKLKQSNMEEGMYHVENGTLFINAGEPYLEHHGVKGMKWGKHLMAGKGEAGAGGGSGEDDEKLKEMAKKAGMSVAEYKQKFASKISGAAAKAKKEIGYAYGSEYKKDFEKAARLHANNKRSMREQAKAAWEGYGESRTAAQKDNWKRYAEYDRQAAASGNMFVKRERSKKAYDNSLASKVDSAKHKARLTQDKAKSKISDAVDAAKKTRDDVKSNIRSKTGIGVKKDIERNARLAEGQKRRAHELTKQVYSAKNKEDWARAYSESNKESFKALDNELKVKKDTKSYPKSIAGRVDSAKRKARLTKDRLESALGKSKQRKQLSTKGPKAKKQISNARDEVEKAARSNENAYKHAKAVYRQTGSDSDAYKQAIKRSGTTLQRYIDSKKLLEKKKRAKHSDDTNAVYTEGTKLVINSKWG